MFSLGGSHVSVSAECYKVYPNNDFLCIHLAERRPHPATLPHCVYTLQFTPDMISLCQQKCRQVPKNHGNIPVFEAAFHVTFNGSCACHCLMTWLGFHPPVSLFMLFSGSLMFVSRFSFPYLLSEFHCTVRWGMSSRVVCSTSLQISGHVWWGVGASAKHSGTLRLNCFVWGERMSKQLHFSHTESGTVTNCSSFRTLVGNDQWREMGKYCTNTWVVSQLWVFVSHIMTLLPSMKKCVAKVTHHCTPFQYDNAVLFRFIN